MMSLFGTAVWQVALFSVIIGAGLPALFAVGIKSMAYGVGGDAEVSHESGHPLGKVVAYLIFAIVLAVILTGLAVIVGSGLGMKVSFEHVYPTFVPKSH